MTIQAIRPIYQFCVGEGATYIMWTDREAGTIVSVENDGSSLVWREDTAELDGWKPEFLIGGFAAHCANQYGQKYRYTQNQSGCSRIFTLRKNGLYVQKGQPIGTGFSLIPGRHKFYDYNF